MTGLLFGAGIVGTYAASAMYVWYNSGRIDPTWVWYSPDERRRWEAKPTAVRRFRVGATIVALYVGLPFVALSIARGGRFTQSRRAA